MLPHKRKTLILFLSVLSLASCINIRQAWNGVAPEGQKGVLAVRTDSPIKECVWNIGRTEYSSEGSRRTDGVAVELLESGTLCKLTIDRATVRDHQGDWDVEVTGNCWDDNLTTTTNRGKRQAEASEISSEAGNQLLPEQNVGFLGGAGTVFPPGVAFRPRNLGVRRRINNPIINPFCKGDCAVGAHARKSSSNRGRGGSSNRLSSGCNNSATRKRIQLKVVPDDSIDVLPGQEEVTGAKEEEVILSARTNAKPTSCKVRRGREDVVSASGGDLEKCNRFGEEDVCTERYEKDGVFACQVRITKMQLAHEGDWTIDVEHQGTDRGIRSGRTLTGSASIKLKYAEKPTETMMTVGNDNYTGENTRDTLELQSGSEVIDCVSKNSNPDPIMELRVDGSTVAAVESTCKSSDRNSVCRSFDFDVDESMDGKVLSCFAYMDGVPPLQDQRRRDVGNIASVRMKVTAGSGRGSSRGKGNSSSGRGGRNKPTLTCADDDRVTVCGENARVGSELQIEVEFESDPQPTKVEWTMQDLKGRRTVITEGNAKGSYVSYVIEEDSKVTGRYIAPLTIEKVSADDLDVDDNHVLTVENSNGVSEFLVTISTARRCTPTQTTGKGSSQCSTSTGNRGSSSTGNRGSSNGSRGTYTCRVESDVDCRCDDRNRECCDAGRRCRDGECCETCSRNEASCNLCDSRGRDCMKLTQASSTSSTSSSSGYDCNPNTDTDCICRGSYCCNNARRCTGNDCCQTCREGDNDCQCDRSGRDCVIVTTLATGQTGVQVCQMEKDPGGCRAAFPKWFFNSQSGQCDTFNYGGCDGNENNFETEQECKDRCSSTGQSTVQSKATKILLDSCLKLSSTLLETYSPEGDKRSTSKSDRQFKTDLEDFFNTAKCTGYDDDILDFIDSKRTSPLKNSKGRKNANFQQQNSQFPSVSFHNHPLNKVHMLTTESAEIESNTEDLISLAQDIQQTNSEIEKDSNSEEQVAGTTEQDL